jgi:hypothetical protein
MTEQVSKATTTEPQTGSQASTTVQKQAEAMEKFAKAYEGLVTEYNKKVG